jgi:hypothetical protein
MIFHAKIKYNEFKKTTNYHPLFVVFLKIRCTHFSGEKILYHFLVDLTPRTEATRSKVFFIVHFTKAFLKYLYKSIGYELPRIQKGDND